MRRRTGLAIATVLVLAAGCVGGQAVLSKGWLPIGPGVGSLFVPRFVGEPVSAQPLPTFEPPQNPHLAANGRNSMHNDAYATDAYTHPGPLGRKVHVTSAWYGVSECATLTFDRAGRLIGLCGGILGPRLKFIDSKSLVVQASLDLPGRVLRAGVSPLEDLCGGAYFYLDNEDRAVVATTDRSVWVVEVPSLVTQRVFSLASWVPKNDCLISLMPDWSGHIWFVTSAGIVGALDPASGEVKTVVLQGERIANSFAVDETGGVFIVSDHALYRFDAGVKLTWRRAYDRGGRLKPSQLSQGSGTTPTLTGGGRVAITDNAEPRMNVLVYDRTDGRLVCSAGVFRSGESATENSIVAVGDSLLVENNFGYTGPLSTLGGDVTAQGVARVDVVDGKCVNVWESAERAPSSVPKASYATGLLYVYTRPSEVDSAAWYLSAIDIRTGRTAFRVLSGVGMQWNNHYAAIALGPDGSAYVATLFGLIRIYDTD